MEKNVFENYLKLCSSILMILNQRCFFITNQFHALVASKPAKIAGIDNPTSGRKAMAGIGLLPSTARYCKPSQFPFEDFERFWMWIWLFFFGCGRVRKKPPP
jgi:hypothetical protein